MPAFLLQWASESLTSPLKNPPSPFGNAVPDSRTRSLCTNLLQNSSDMHVEKVVDGDRATFILSGPDLWPNHVSQVSQTRFSQGFTNDFFAVLCLFRKISKVSQIRVFASFRKYKFRKVSQIGFSFRKLSQVSQGFCNGQLLMFCQCFTPFSI